MVLLVATLDCRPTCRLAGDVWSIRGIHGQLERPEPTQFELSRLPWIGNFAGKRKRVNMGTVKCVRVAA